MSAPIRTESAPTGLLTPVKAKTKLEAPGAPKADRQPLRKFSVKRKLDFSAEDLEDAFVERRAEIASKLWDRYDDLCESISSDMRDLELLVITNDAEKDQVFDTMEVKDEELEEGEIKAEAPLDLQVDEEAEGEDKRRR